MSIPIFRTDDKALRTLGVHPGAYGWLSVTIAWITRGRWYDKDELQLHWQWPLVSPIGHYNYKASGRISDDSRTIRDLIMTKRWKTI